MGAQLFLADLAGMNDDHVREHIVGEYECAASDVNRFDILIAYQSVGSWGCDSSSFFLLRDRQTGELFENHGSHCSCYGFEGQWSPEQTTLEYLQSEHFNFGTGGYDDDDEKHRREVKEFIAKMDIQNGGTSK